VKDERVPELVDHLFRHEAGRMVAVLTRLVGFSNIDLAEDVVQDVLTDALEVWKYDRVPQNPAAWLMRAARNRAIDAIRKQRTVRKFSPDVAALLATEWALIPTVDEAVFGREIADAELRLMFSLCDGRLPAESQPIVILKYLCGFGVHELSHAFLSSPAAIEKRLSRARATLRAAEQLVELEGGPKMRPRVSGVCQALYLLFSEGYHGSHPEQVVRADLCSEALRLCVLVASHPRTADPQAHALLALMCFSASRLDARLDADGSLIPLQEQDRSRWDQTLIARGFAALQHATAGNEVSDYHYEAAISAKHCIAPSYRDTDWAGILELYDALYARRPTPIVALNRAIALAEVEGPDAALKALDSVDGARLEHYPFYAAARAELERRAGRLVLAREHYGHALALARNAAERKFFERRLSECF
jgi:RNA polymerase sigma-70 factor (ECF subfamily)